MTTERISSGSGRARETDRQRERGSPSLPRDGDTAIRRSERETRTTRREKGRAEKKTRIGAWRAGRGSGLPASARGEGRGREERKRGLKKRQC